jgi:hypothetical protein
MHGAKSPVDLTKVLLLPAVYTKPWARNVGRNSPDSPVFPGICQGLLLLKGTFQDEGSEFHTLQNVCYSTHNKRVCVCVYLFMCFSACVCVCVSVFVGAIAHRVVWIIFLLSVSVRYPFQKMAVTIDFWKSIISDKSNFLFCRSSCIYSVRRNYSAFRVYVKCMSRHHDTWVIVHH